MRICGFQKLTLLDFPGRTACTVFTKGCTLRCGFCHNASLVTEDSEEIDSKNFFDFLDKRRNLLDGVCITGGEPLLQNDIEDFAKKIKEYGFLVKLDTNGTFPDKLMHIVNDGLVDYVAMDIKNSPEEYAKTAGVNELKLEPIYKSIEFLLSGKIEYEFRTTIVRGLHTEDSIIKAAQMIKGAEKYFLQNFVCSDNVIDATGLSSFSAVEMANFADKVRPYVKSVQLRGI